MAGAGGKARGARGARVWALALFAALVGLPGAALPREVWHATRALQPGDVLRAEDVEPRIPQRDNPRFADAERDIIGLEAKRRLRAGAPIAERDIGEPEVVRAAQMIRVFWKSGGVTLEMEGRALEAGALGEEIRIHNPGSGRTIRARVVAQGTAEVRGAP